MLQRHEAERIARADAVRGEASLDVKLDYCTSEADLLRLDHPDLRLEILHADGLVICATCYKHTMQGSSTGVFKRGQRFAILRNSLKEHVKNDAHAEALRHERILAKVHSALWAEPWMHTSCIH